MRTLVTPPFTPAAKTIPSALDFVPVNKRQQAAWASGEISVVVSRIVFPAEQPAEAAERAPGFDRNAGSGPIATTAGYFETVIVRK